MVDHHWGDPAWDEWEALEEAQVEMRAFVKRWTGCYVSTKEKYGTIRYEFLNVPDYVRHLLLIHQGLYTWVYHMWYKVGYLALRHIVYKLANGKYKHIKEEILEDFWWPYE